MCIRDRAKRLRDNVFGVGNTIDPAIAYRQFRGRDPGIAAPVSYTHLRAHETVLDLVCRLLLEKKNHNQ